MGSFASSTTAASNSTPTSWKEVSARLCSIGKKRAVRWSRSRGGELGGYRLTCRDPANCMVSCKTTSPIASRRNHEGDQRARPIQRGNQAIGTVVSEIAYSRPTTRSERPRSRNATTGKPTRSNKALGLVAVSAFRPHQACSPVERPKGISGKPATRRVARLVSVSAFHHGPHEKPRRSGAQFGVLMIAKGLPRSGPSQRL